jgi:sialate O-acetylesterase
LDVLVGEVWLGSGQSNMEVAAKPLPQFTTTSHPFDCDEATRQLLAAGAKLDIRISAVTRDHWKNPHWAVLSKENFLEAPALMTSVATLLREKLDVPVGVIVRCESSSTSGIWLSRDAVENDAEIQRQIRNYATNEYPRLVAAYPRRVKDWEAAAAKAKAAGGKIPVKPAAPTLPGGFPVNRGFSGNVFYSEGRLNHYGVNYVTRIEPVIPFAVRGIVWDQGENGTGIAGADQTAVMPALVRSWRAAWGSDNLPFFYIRKNQHPATLPEVMATLPDTFQIDNRGLSQITHPPDKSAYARRVVEQMELHIYNQNGLPK